MILEQFDVLTTAGLDCRSCEEWQKRDFGCGAPPIVDGHDGHEEWTPQKYAVRCIQNGAYPFDGEIDPAYSWADFAYANEFGFLWPCCPRFFLEKSNPAAASEAIRILSMIRASSDPIMAAQHAGPMTPREVSLYRLAQRFEDRQIQEAHKAAREAAEQQRRLKNANKSR